MNNRIKPIILTLLLGLFCNFLFAQDLIIMRNGDEVKAKVSEILQDQIKFKKWDNQDGPMYTENKSSIFMIKYQNGTKEVFDQQSKIISNKQNSEVSNVDIKFQLSQLDVEKCVREFVGKNSFSGGNSWGESGDFNVRSIKAIERMVQFSETEASTVVNFSYKDAFSSNSLSLKFTFKRDIQNNWFLTSVEKIKSDGGSQRMQDLLYKWREINIPVIKDFNSSYGEIKNSTDKPIVNIPVDVRKYIGKLTTETNKYVLKIEALEIFDELGNNSEISNTILKVLSDLKFVSKTFNDPADTISLIAIIRLRYITNSVNGTDFFFTDGKFQYSLINSKNGNLICNNNYEESNFSKYSNGFSSKLSSARNLISNRINQSLHQFFIGNFPITGQITEITKKNRKETEAKFVRINLGKDIGIFPNYEFILKDLNSNSLKGDIQVTEVFENYSLCKVLNFEKEICDMIKSGKAVLVKTKYKASY